jgi:nitroreductase
MGKLKTLIKPYYLFVRKKLKQFNSFFRAKTAEAFLPETYWREVAFFEGIRSKTYNDNEYLIKRLRGVAHYVEKSLTLTKKPNATSAIKQTETLLNNIHPITESDNTAYRWASELISYYRNPQANISPDATGPVTTNHDDVVLTRIIQNRRSIRSYKQQTIEKDVLYQILESGHWAPCSCNRQPIEYLVVDRLEDVLFCQKYAGELSCFPQEAAVNIVVLVDPRGYALPHQRHMAFLDSGAAIQNILLTTHSLGLGACWMNWARTDEKFHQRFKLAPWLLPVSLICIGHTNIQPPVLPRRKSVGDSIHQAGQD